MQNNYKNFFLILATLTILSACSQVSQSRDTNLTHSGGSNETGKASYYADKYQGRQTANGERFNQNAKTAAHKSLAFGTWVKVTNISNGKSVIVRINDRGPFIKDRIIDLSKSAFSSIANPRLGIVNITLEIIR
jgi:rare lipoprotein A